eukprot:m.27973 g.27973  ORF g.27973 m.27973 type:complete len:72 (+) comp10186_c0_seq1:97-312(+)
MDPAIGRSKVEANSAALQVLNTESADLTAKLAAAKNHWDNELQNLTAAIANLSERQSALQKRLLQDKMTRS